MIYLDYAANTPPDERVVSCFSKTIKRYIGNPNSNHPLGWEAKKQLDAIVTNIASYFGVKPEEVILTSGASESNNLAIKGIANTYRQNGKHIISTCLEHASVSGSLTFLQSRGYEIDLVDILPDGTVDLVHLKELLRKDTVLVTLCYVDSELGIRQPIEAIGELLKNYPNCFFHVDATQAIGKCRMNTENVDLFSVAPHKFYGLNGCGLLIKKEEVIVEPMIHGGTSSTLYRSGTPDIGMAASINKALELAITELEERTEMVTEINHYLSEQLKKYPKVVLHQRATTLPHFINLSVKGISAVKMQEEMNARGVCISTKSACSVPNTPSRAVYAITKDKKMALSSWRISLSHLTKTEELEKFLRAFGEIYKQYCL